MRKIILFMHVSADGFAAGPGGEMDWIHVDDEIFEYAGNRTDQSDVALYGRVTFEMMESYWPNAADQPNASKHDIQHSSWYNKVEKIVISKTLKGGSSRMTIIGDDIKNNIEKIKQKTGKDILMFGSPSAAHSLMKENLIDDYWLFVNPVLLGKGIPVFTKNDSRIQLKLMESKAFSSGVVCLHYEKIS